MFLFFMYLSHSWTPKNLPGESNELADWFWWSTMSIKRTIYYSISMVFFFASLALCICGVLENRKSVEHIKL